MRLAVSLPFPGRGVLLAILVLCGLVHTAWSNEPTLQQERANRRASLRARSVTAAKARASVPFGLLVIPVDFSDARLPQTWDRQDLSDRLTPDAGETLHNYFRIASDGLLDLRIIQAPVVHLPEGRRQYSDRDLNGFSRTRRLATEALSAVRDQGLEFRRLDIDGPDGIAGTADDDGEVDGVLILHAGIGNENDAEAGLIQALQFFLEEPVSSQGVAASFYAVASLHSGPGIWAHETGHLLGFEDRYDPLLHPSGNSEVQSVGGLGRFSLMSSGAWGTGGGYGAALPDAYSAQQVGWRQVRNLANSAEEVLPRGAAARVWTGGAVGPEYFLAEVRSPVDSYPFDANLVTTSDEPILLIYHVDENLAEGTWHDDGNQRWHLRVGLVEADDDRSLTSGDDDGQVTDYFWPGDSGRSFSAQTRPPSTGYYAGPSRIALTNFRAADSGAAVAFGVSTDSGPSLTFTSSFGGQGSSRPLALQVQETGAPLSTVQCRMTAVASGGGGYFAATGSNTITFPLAEQDPGQWVPASPVAWVLDASPGAAAATDFEFVFYNANTSYARATRTWVWRSLGTELDFQAAWPGQWVVDHPAGNIETTWHRWDTAPWLTADQVPVLACTGAAFTSAATWPSVTYGNNAYTTLTSAPLAGDVGGVRLTHGIEVEMLTGQTAMDGGRVSWVGPDGTEYPAQPLAGYGGQIAPKSVNPLHGQKAFVGAALPLLGTEIVWRTDTFLVPDAGTGPWRLRLIFGSNSLWRARGWFIADLEAIPTGLTAVDFVPTWDGDLVWAWPWDNGLQQYFGVETRPDPRTDWAVVAALDLVPDLAGHFRLAGEELLQLLPGGPRQRHEVRVYGQQVHGRVASQALVLYPDGGDGSQSVFGAPWPNPALDTVHFLLNIPAGSQAVLRIFDAAGRLVTRQTYPDGEHLTAWNGRTATGQRAPAGVYFFRLEGSGPVLTRKVVLLH